MFHLKFNFDTSGGRVNDIEIGSDSFNQNAKSEIKEALEKLQIENPCLIFTRKMQAGKFDNFQERELVDLAYVSNIISDCWVYPDAPLKENGESDLRPYMGVMNLLQNFVNVILKMRRELDDYYKIYGKLQSDNI